MRHTFCLLLVFIVFIGACSGCARKCATGPTAAVAPAPRVQEAPVHTVTAAQAGKFLASHQDALILDVRTPRERLNGYIPHSRSVPVCDILSGAYAPPQDKPLLLTCASGGRSLAAAKFLAHEGYTRVYNLRGGFSAWRQAGLPVEKQ